MANKKTEKFYDIGFHIIPSLSEKESGKIFADICDSIVKQGEVVGRDEPKKTPLRYTIRHAVRQEDGSYNRYDEAYFGSVKFKAAPEQVTAIEEGMRENDAILRYLLIETVAEETRTAPLVSEKKEESGRSGKTD